MKILYRNDVDDYPSLDEIEEPIRDSLISYFSGYYDNPEELADELISDGEIYLNNNSNTVFELRNV